jgi:hypothetical protein
MHSQWRSTRWAAPAVAVLLAACANPPQSPGNTRVAAPTAGASTTAPVNSTEAKAPAAQHTTAARPTRVGHRPIPAPSTTPALRPVNLKQFIDGDLPVLDDTEVSFFRGQRSCDASRRAVYMTEQFVVIEFNFHAPNAVGNCSLSIVNRSSLESPTGTHRIVALSNAQGVTEEAYLKSRPQFAIYSRNGMQPTSFQRWCSTARARETSPRCGRVSDSSVAKAGINCPRSSGRRMCIGSPWRRNGWRIGRQASGG